MNKKSIEQSVAASSDLNISCSGDVDGQTSPVKANRDLPTGKALDTLAAQTFKRHDRYNQGNLEKDVMMAALGEISSLFSMSARDALDLDAEKCRWKRFTTADFVSICSRLGTQQIQRLRDERIKNTGAIKTQIPPGADSNPDLQLVFESYCHYKALSQEPGESGMSQQQLYKLCVDIGLTAPEGGPLSVPEMDVAYARVKGPPHVRRINYQQWLMLLCILSDKSGWDLFTIMIYHAQKLDENGMLPQPPPQQLRNAAGTSTANSVSTSSSMRTPGSIMFSEVDFQKGEQSSYQSSAQSSTVELMRNIQPSGKGEYVTIKPQALPQITEDMNEDRPSPSMSKGGRQSFSGRSVNSQPGAAPLAEHSTSSEMPSWLPGLLLRLTKLEQKADARERADLARGHLPPSREGERASQLLNQKRSSAPGGADSLLEEKKNQAINEAILLKRAKEACRQVATDIVNQGIHEMEIILQKADAAAEQAHQASLQAAFSSENDGPSVELRVKELGDQLKATMTRLSTLDDKVTTIGKGKLEASSSSESLSGKSDKEVTSAVRMANEAAFNSANAIKEAEKAQKVAREAVEMTKAVALDLANLSQVVGLQQQQGVSNNAQLMAIQSHLKSVVTLTEVMQSKQDQLSADVTGLRSQPRASAAPAADHSNHASRLQRLEADLQQLASFSGEVAGRFTALERDIVSTLKTYARSSDLKEAESSLIAKHNQLQDALAGLKKDIHASSFSPLVAPSLGSGAQLQPPPKFTMTNPARISHDGPTRMQYYMVPTAAQQVHNAREMMRYNTMSG